MTYFFCKMILPRSDFIQTMTDSPFNGLLQQNLPIGEEQLFYSFCLEEVVPDDHEVRAIASVLDLSWVYGELSPHYPALGRPSIDPILMIRMLILGYAFGLRSERLLCREVRVNLA